MTEDTWLVYQLHSDTELLYVGYTHQRLKARLGYHRRGKPWWPEVTDIRSEEFATEGAARQREKEIWATESPKYNKRNPFLTAEERDALARERARAWNARNPERKREQSRERQRRYLAKPEKLAAYRAMKHDWWERKGRAARAARRAQRGQQSGPSLFD